MNNPKIESTRLAARVSFVLVVSLALATLSGCATIATVAQHHKLAVSSKVSQSVFLDPLSPAEKIVYVNVHNTSTKPGFHVQSPIVSELRGQGWTVTDNPDQANVLLQINIRQAGQASQNAVAAAMQSGYQGGIARSAVAAAGLAAVSGSNARGAGAAALAAGAADFVGGLLVSNNFYSTIADVRISERGQNGQTYAVTHVRHQGNTGVTNPVQNSLSLASGRITALNTGGQAKTYTTTSPFKRQQTRILVSAEQINLTWAEAVPVLSKKLAQTIGGIL